MGKISPVSAKYIVHADIDIEGVVDRPDVIGAIFGQTEGLLGSELELRELQRSGRIGRIEVTTDTRGGKTTGKIIIPSSLDKAETAIVGAALEIIQRIGPCNAKIKVGSIEDIRISKRSFVIERAKELLRQLTENVLPDSQELADEVTYSVRVMEIMEYGKDRLPAGPAIDESDEILVVEGRADVLNLLKHGFKNALAMNGTSVPETVIELSKKKVITAFVDGDRGGNLIIKELSDVADIDYVCQAPDGKEVEELTKKELHKALRSRVAAEQAKLEIGKQSERNHRPSSYVNRNKIATKFVKKVALNSDQKTAFQTMLEELIGTRGAYILDEKMAILGKVPVAEIPTTVKSLGRGIHAIVFDGSIDMDLVRVAERSNVDFLVAMTSKTNPRNTKIRILTEKDF